ncbi:hypothetical protein PGT21_002420 [Puccinia graminis f. sp. tritici]|uniref:Uncharacterized protein n=1 Tax=Puccinia graminis f. sp. tritici TaxID=56615 RepID=A0A5B0M3C4_PUCGR|nr:hypothetical protein PGTUg99_004706 [Puccinia graminis f. sp. tritici]KAA1071292.1 hypothetical protein PGT21_002420 [Puccinia graminis f. sp. tritici]
MTLDIVLIKTFMILNILLPTNNTSLMPTCLRISPTKKSRACTRHTISNQLISIITRTPFNMEILLDMLIPLNMAIHFEMPIWNMTWRGTDLAIKIPSSSRTNLTRLDMPIWNVAWHGTDLAIKIPSSSRTNLTRLDMPIWNVAWPSRSSALPEPTSSTVTVAC